jgi:hypothetical protein
MISGYTDPAKSDTWLFNEDILQPFVDKWGNLGLFQDPVQKLIEARIGYSKLIFMDNTGNTKIFNEDKGVWDNDVWYSNSSYKKPAPYVPPPPSTYYPPRQASFLTNRYYDNKQTWAYKKENIALGELVTLLSGQYDAGTKSYFPKDSIWEIVAINRDYSVDLMADSADENSDIPNFLYNIKFLDIELLEEDYESPVEAQVIYPYGVI